ncbi:MAG: pyridoxamine 5'-phosphate oxidase family protein [bacterium]|nr:pyridoxamine 5'-phosphate oxidase family protein [bacterium]
MATRYTALSPEQLDLIRESRLFFVASAHPDLEPGPEGQGPVNCSPKGNVPLAVIDERTVAYLDYHGSGNETARHADAEGPITLMFMSMDAIDAAIVRLYGRAETQSLEASPYAEQLLKDCRLEKGLRQIVVVHIASTQTSCGYGVPVCDYRNDREASQRGRRFK